MRIAVRFYHCLSHSEKPLNCGQVLLLNHYKKVTASSKETIAKLYKTKKIESRRGFQNDALCFKTKVSPIFYGIESYLN